MLRLDCWVQNSGASLYHSPKGKDFREHLASPNPLALHPWSCRCRLPGDAWERAALTDSVLTFSFPKRRCLVSQPIPIAEGWSRETWVEGVCTDVETEKPKEES